MFFSVFKIFLHCFYSASHPPTHFLATIFVRCLSHNDHACEFVCIEQEVHIEFQTSAVNSCESLQGFKGPGVPYVWFMGLLKYLSGSDILYIYRCGRYVHDTYRPDT